MQQNVPDDPYELIEELAPDPSDVPFLAGLDGYLGRSDREGHVRLYRDLSLSYWLDIPERGVRKTMTVNVAGKFYPITVVWVEHGAPVHPHLLNNEDSNLAAFLQGEFTAGGLLDVELPEGYESPTGLWCNNLQGTIRHDRREGHWTRCR